MFFQFSPTFTGKPKETPKEQDETTELSLAPFTANPKIEFDNIKVGTTVTKNLLIRNPTGRDFNINVTDNIPEELNFSLNWRDCFIPKGQSANLEITWNPLTVVSTRYSIILSDGRLRRTVFLTLKSILPVATKGKTSRKSKTSPKKTVFRTSVIKKLSPNIQFKMPKLVITSADKRSTFSMENKENIPNLNGRETFTIIPSKPLRCVTPEENFNDSLENATNSIPSPQSGNLESKLRALSFDDSPSTTKFSPNVLSTISEPPDSLKLNVSSETYTKETSYETYIKSHASFETYVKNNFSSGTYVKDSSLADLSALSPVNETQYKHLVTISEESSFRKSLELRSVSRKRKSTGASSTIPIKRLSLEFSIYSKTIHYSTEKLSPTILYNVDPFMNSHLFGIDYIESQQTLLEKWLNALLTPPAELDAIVEVDPVKVWQECKTNTVNAAPTKELVSCNYHTNHKLDLLRANAKQFYNQEDIKEIYTKISNLIDADRISVRKDKEIHLNLSLKKCLVTLILSYNPLWLRIGLETIYGEKLLLQSNSDVKGLTNFLMERLFKCPTLLKKYKTIYSPKYLVELNKFFLKKFFALVYLLDRAKTEHLITHDPCLFCRNAEIKSSREILLCLSREVLASMGDITKFLKMSGYVVVHTQTYINEFQYAVTSLGSDLRDGVRLARVMEIVLLRNDLTQKLRVPAISRLQKIHNMNVVFQALTESGFEIQYDIHAKDLVEGHKEQTLSFLWQLIYKFQTPLMHKKASVIQTWFRSVKITLKRRMLKRVYERRKKAANIIGSWYRKVKLDQKYEEIRRQEAAIKIQKNVRMFICRKRFLVERSVIEKIQVHAKGWLLRNYHQKRIKAAVFIQRKYRAMKLMKQQRSYYLSLKLAVRIVAQRYTAKKLMIKEREYYNRLKTACRFVQQTVRRNRLFKFERNEFVKQREAGIKIQQWYRAKKAMINQRSKYLEMKSSAILIQAQFRAFTCRQRLIALKKSTIFIQRLYRANKAMICQRKKFVNEKAAAVKIQRWYRATKLMIDQRTNYKSLVKTVVVVQAKFRAKKQLRQFTALKETTIFIQRLFRASKLMRENRGEFLCKKRAAVKIQQWYRAQKAMIVLHLQYQELRKAAIVIQRRFRAHKRMKLEHKQFVELKKSTVFVQRLFRANKLMKGGREGFLLKKQASVKIQQWYRAQKAMILHRSQYQEIKRATVIIQRRFRAQKLMKFEHQQFTQLKSSTVFVQRLFRANKQMRIEQKEFLAKKQASIKIQQWYRAQKAMIVGRSEYQELKRAAIIIQRHYRAQKLKNIECHRFNQLRTSTLFVQRLFRANKLMKLERQEFLLNKQAAIKIQQWYKAQKAMVLHRTRYQEVKQAAIIIQRRFRAQKLKNIECQQFIQLKSSTVFVQRLFRANKLMKLQREDFLSKKRATVKIQVWYKAQKAMIMQRTQYQTLKSAAIMIQTRFKAQKLMKIEHKQFVKLKTSTLFVQRTFRANKLMKECRKEYLIKKQAAVKIQEWYRKEKAMIEQRTQFRKMKKAAIVIQQRFRAQKQMKIEKENFVKLKRGTIFIQQLYRANKSMEICRKHFVESKKAAITIQSWYRCKKTMIQERTKYLQLKSSVIIIQRRFRAQRLMKQERKYFIQTRTSISGLQSYCRGFLVRSKYKDYFSEEAKEQRRVEKLQNAAATKIQAAYRSYRQRKQNAPALIAICRRVQAANRNFKEEDTLGSRWRRCLFTIQHEWSTINQIIAALIQCEYITRRCITTCYETASFMPEQLYLMLNATIRSLPEAELCSLSAKILINYCKLEETRQYSFIEKYINNTITIMLHWCDKDNDVFPTLCTLIWLFGHVPEWKVIICNLPNVKQRFQKMEGLCNRKQAMVLKTGVKSVTSYFGPYKNLPMPTTKPDWGLDYKGKPHLFTHAVHALHSVYNVLFN